MSPFQMPKRFWQIASRLIQVVIWLDLSFVTSANCFYAFLEAFDCDDGLQTGSICSYSFTALYLGVLTFLGLMLWGLWKVLPGLPKRL